MQDSLPAGGLRLYREGVEPSGSLRKVSGYISILLSRTSPVARVVYAVTLRPALPALVATRKPDAAFFVTDRCRRSRLASARPIAPAPRPGQDRGEPRSLCRRVVRWR